eukprot:COSAG02_NODE_6557_length_3497_cov_3.085344_4_plen_164_part_00
MLPPAGGRLCRRLSAARVRRRAVPPPINIFSCPHHSSLPRVLNEIIVARLVGRTSFSSPCAPAAPLGAEAEHPTEVGGLNLRISEDGQNWGPSKIIYGNAVSSFCAAARFCPDGSLADASMRHSDERRAEYGLLLGGATFSDEHDPPLPGSEGDPAFYINGRR